MSPLWSAWSILAVVLMSGAFLVWAVSNFLDLRRTDALTLVAQQLGFSYEHDGAPFQPGLEVPLLTTGRRRAFSHVLRGVTAGMETSLFDYRYTTGAGKNSRTHKQTVAAYRLPYAVASFWLHTATWQDKVGIWFGGQSIGFGDDPEFSKRYRLQGRDEFSLRQFFTPAVRSYFESLPENRWHIETSEGWILVYESEHRLPPEAITDFLQNTSNLVAGFIGLLRADSDTHHSLAKA